MIGTVSDSIVLILVIDDVYICSFHAIPQLYPSADIVFARTGQACIKKDNFSLRGESSSYCPESSARSLALFRQSQNPLICFLFGRSTWNKQ